MYMALNSLIIEVAVEVKMRKVSYVAGITLLGLALAAGSAAQAATVYDEGVSGDLSNVGATPNPLAFAPGDNRIFGSTGRGTNDVVDRDYFTFTVLPGFVLSAIEVLPGTTSIGGRSLSFIGMEAGNQMTVLPTSMSAAGLLGWRHYSPADINTDILDDMAIPVAGSSGFTTPLGSGAYSIWIQETAVGSANYGFNFRLSAVPEPETWAMLILGFGFLGAGMRSQRRTIRFASRNA